MKKTNIKVQNSQTMVFKHKKLEVAKSSDEKLSVLMKKQQEEISKKIKEAKEFFDSNFCYDGTNKVETEKQIYENINNNVQMNDNYYLIPVDVFYQMQFDLYEEFETIDKTYFSFEKLIAVLSYFNYIYVYKDEYNISRVIVNKPYTDVLVIPEITDSGKLEFKTQLALSNDVADKMLGYINEVAWESYATVSFV